MWRLIRDPSISEPESRDLILEISQSITRGAVFILLGPLLAFTYVLGAAQPVRYLGPVMILSTVAVIAGWLVFRLVQSHLFIAQVALQVGVLLVVTLALLLFNRPEIALGYALLPLLAAITTGWPFAILAEVVVIALAVLFAQPGSLVPANLGVLAALSGAMTGALGALSTTSLIGVTQRAYRDSRIARLGIEETRRQRMELIQTQEDLLQANSELARLSDRLKVLTQVAEDARRVKEEFVANVSHELRTPLNMIIGFSELIAKAPRVYGELPPALLADIAAIQRNSQHLSELVNDVLDLSQIEAGRMALVKDWTTLQELVESAMSATQVLFEMKGLYLKSELPAEPARLLCDRTRIREVLLNLLSNAGRFTDQGGVLIRAWEEKGSPSGEQFILSVSDTGPGIAPEDQGRLFEPFQQLDNSIRREGGSGLGLSISKRFVEMHGGRMWLSSQVGQGTTFFFSLPIRTPVDAPAPTGAVSASRRWITPYHQFEVAARRSKAPAPQVGPRFVLLDPGNGLRRLFSRYVENIELVNAASLDEALEELARLPSQALIVNRATTGLNSSALKRGASAPYGAPMMTCWVAGDDEPARRLGVAAYLLKPVSRERLLNTLQGLGRAVHTILLVDDQPEILQLFARILNSAEQGYVVLRARSGVQALQTMRERRPDVVLLDLTMPGMDGFQVINEKNRDETIRDIPVVIISSKDPTGAPIVSDQLTVTRQGGLSARELLTCVCTISEILAPEAGPRPAGHAHEGPPPEGPPSSSPPGQPEAAQA